MEALSAGGWDVLWFYTPLLDSVQHAFGIFNPNTVYFYRVVDFIVGEVARRLPEDTIKEILQTFGKTLLNLRGKVERDMLEALKTWIRLYRLHHPQNMRF